LIGLGLLGLLAGAGLSGVWIAFMGWFLMQAVHEEETFARIEQAVRGMRVRDLMAPDPVTVGPDWTLDEVAATIRRSPHGAYPVVSDHHVVGLLTRAALGAVPAETRARLTVADVMLATSGVPVVGPDESVVSLLDRLHEAPGRVVVLDGAAGDELVGLISVSDLVSNALR
jgi:CBS domain-containing protein